MLVLEGSSNLAVLIEHVVVDNVEVAVERLTDRIKIFVCCFCPKMCFPVISVFKASQPAYHNFKCNFGLRRTKCARQDENIGGKRVED